MGRQGRRDNGVETGFPTSHLVAYPGPSGGVAVPVRTACRDVGCAQRRASGAVAANAHAASRRAREDHAMEPTFWFWATFNAAVLGLLLLDLGLFGRKDANGDPVPVPVRTALLKSAAYVLLALGFFGFLWTSYGPEAGRQARALEFLTGYVIEWSLSVDNIFI